MAKKMILDETDRAELQAQIEERAKLTDVSSPYNFKGKCTLAELPGSGNVLNDTYYCTDVKTRYTWNGSAWYQSSLNESEYLDELSRVKTVAVSTTEPTDENVQVWVNPEEESTDPEDPEGETTFLTESDIAQGLGDRADMVLSQKTATEYIYPNFSFFPVNRIRLANRYIDTDGAISDISTTEGSLASKRITHANFIYALAGSVITPREGYEIFIATYEDDMTFIARSDWAATPTKIEEDGFVLIEVRKASDTAITPEEAFANVDFKIITKKLPSVAERALQTDNIVNTFHWENGGMNFGIDYELTQRPLLSNRMRSAVITFPKDRLVRFKQKTEYFDFSVTTFDENDVMLQHTSYTPECVMDSNDFAYCRVYVLDNTNEHIILPTQITDYLEITYLPKVTKGENILHFADLDETQIGDGTISIKNGKIHLNGSMNGAPIKLSTTVRVGFDESWFDDTINILEVGKRYKLVYGVESGTFEHSLNNLPGLVLYAKDKSVISSSAQNSFVYDGTEISHVRFNPSLSTCTNAVIGVALVEVEDDTTPTPTDFVANFYKDEIAKDKQFLEFVKQHYYPTVEQIRCINLYNDTDTTDIDGNTGVCQGGTSDGERYIYYANWHNSDSLLTTLKKYDLETNEIVLTNRSKSYHHANDMTYCNADNKLYISHSTGSGVWLISIVNTETLECEREINLLETVLPQMPEHERNKILDIENSACIGIAYDKTKEKFLFMDKHEKHYVIVCDKNMNYERIIRFNAPKFSGRQGLFTDAKFIYTLAWNSDVQKSYLYAWDWRGNLVWNVAFADSREVESGSVIDKKFYFTFNSDTSPRHIQIDNGIPARVGYRYKVDVLSQYNLN